MKKVFLMALGAGLFLTACNKKQETTTVEETVTTTTAEDGVVTTETTTTTEAETVTIGYVSADEKTKFTVVSNPEAGTATVTNETTGKVYEMKNVPTGSGVRYEDADKNFFETHQGEFSFGNGETVEVQGKELK